jgi:hypothetical protein
MIVLAWMACALPSGGPRWTAVDVGAVEAALASPTASEEDVLRWLVTHADELGGRIDASTTLVDAVGLVAASPEADHVERDEGELSGTEVYVRVACPGPGRAPDADFEHGLIQIESPLLSLEDIDELGVRGDLLLTAEACRRGESVLDGAVAAWYDAPDQVLVVDGAMALDRPEGELSLPLLAVLGESWGFVIPVFGATLSMDVDPAAPAAGVLRYEGGQLSCQLQPVVDCGRGAGL